MTSEEAAWVAGFLEGEGYCGITKNGKGYSIKLAVEQKFPRPLEEIQKLTGSGRLNKLNGRDAYRLAFRKDEIPAVVESVLPFLRYKEEQFLLLLEGIANPGSIGEYADTMKYLKASGR